MPVRVERSRRVITVIHSRPEARNAVDPEHAEALYEAFLAFDNDYTADIAVFWGEGGSFCAGATSSAWRRVALLPGSPTRKVLQKRSRLGGNGHAG